MVLDRVGISFETKLSGFVNVSSQYASFIACAVRRMLKGVDQHMIFTIRRGDGRLHAYLFSEQHRSPPTSFTVSHHQVIDHFIDLADLIAP